MPSYYVTASIKLCPEVGNQEYIILRNFNGRSMSSLLHYKRVFPSVYWFLYPDANKALENQVNANVAVGEVCSVIRLFYGALNYLGMFEFTHTRLSAPRKLIFGVDGVQEMFFRLAKKVGRQVEF